MSEFEDALTDIDYPSSSHFIPAVKPAVSEAVAYEGTNYKFFKTPIKTKIVYSYSFEGEYMYRSVNFSSMPAPSTPLLPSLPSIEDVLRQARIYSSLSDVICNENVRINPVEMDFLVSC